MSFGEYAKFDDSVYPPLLINSPDVITFAEDSLLGKGGYGSVYKIIGPDGKFYALKLFDDDSPDSISLMEMELDNMKELSKYPNCDPDFSCMIDFFTLPGTDGNYVAILSDFIDGTNLYDIDNFSNDDAVDLLEWIVPVLQKMHQKGFVHRDIKPGNIMLTEDGSFKLIDFGISCSDSSNKGRKCIYDGLGTPNMRPPEVDRQQYDKTIDHSLAFRQLKSADIFMLGVTLYYLLFRKYPYPNPVSNQDLGTYDRENTYDDILNDMIDGMLDTDYKQRLTSEKILDMLKEHKIIPDYTKIIYSGDAGEIQNIIRSNKKDKFFNSGLADQLYGLASVYPKYQKIINSKLFKKEIDISEEYGDESKTYQENLGPLYKYIYDNDQRRVKNYLKNSETPSADAELTFYFMNSLHVSDAVIKSMLPYLHHFMGDMYDMALQDDNLMRVLESYVDESDDDILAEDFRKYKENSIFDA